MGNWYITEEGFYVSGAGEEFDHLPAEEEQEAVENIALECSQNCAHCTRGQLGLCGGHDDVDEDDEPEEDSDEL